MSDPAKRPGLKGGWWLVAFAGALVCVLIAFAPTIHFGMVWVDDRQLLVNVQTQPGWDGFKRAFCEGFFLYPQGYWRPLPLTTYQLTNLVPLDSRLSAAHAFSVLLGLAYVVCVFAAGRTIVKALPGIDGPVVPLLCLYIAIHPALVETVAWISGRFDLLLAISALLVFSFALSDCLRPSRMKLVELGAAIALGLLSKEIAPMVSFSAMLAAFALRAIGTGPGFDRPLVRRALAQCAVWIVLTALWAAAYSSVADHSNVNRMLTARTATADQFGLALWALGMYTKVLLLPWLFVAPVHAAPLDPFGGAIFGAAVLVVVTVPVIWCLARKQRALCALIAALAGPIVALSLLASTARFALEVTAADRYLLPFMPAFLGALCLCAAKIRAATRTRPRAFRRLLPLAVAAMALAGCTFDRTYAYAWYDKTIFWGSVWVRNHDSSMAAVSWSADLFGRGQIEPALAVLKLRSDALRESHSPFAEPTLYWNQLVIGTYAERLGDAGRSEAALAELRYWISERRVVTPILLRVLAMDRARLGECAEARKLSDLVESSADTSFMFISSDDEKNKLHALLDACWQRE